MSEENYQELHAQNISRGQLIEEHERKIEALDIQLKTAREQFEYQLKTLVDTKKELDRIAVCPYRLTTYDRNYWMTQSNIWRPRKMN